MTGELEYKLECKYHCDMILLSAIDAATTSCTATFNYDQINIGQCHKCNYM